MKKIVFAIVMILSFINGYGFEINGVNFYDTNFKETFSFNAFKSETVELTKITDEAYVLLDYKFNNINDGGTCKITYYWKTENNTYEGRSATYDNVYLSFIEKNGVKAYSIMDETNGKIATIGSTKEADILIIYYSGDFNDVNIRFE